MNSNENIVYIKSKAFAIEIIKLFRFLTDSKNEFILSKQLLRSGTSIGANIAESEYASSDKDFLNKLYVALKECNETIYWLELLKETGYIEKDQFQTAFFQCSEIKRILASSTKTIKEKLND